MDDGAPALTSRRPADNEPSRDRDFGLHAASPLVPSESLYVLSAMWEWFWNPGPVAWLSLLVSIATPSVLRFLDWRKARKSKRPVVDASYWAVSNHIGLFEVQVSVKNYAQHGLTIETVKIAQPTDALLRPRNASATAPQVANLECYGPPAGYRFLDVLEVVGEQQPPQDVTNAFGTSRIDASRASFSFLAIFPPATSRESPEQFKGLVLRVEGRMHTSRAERFGAKVIARRY
jgi:hypothetical protein